MIDINLKPTEKQLRQFAWVSLVGFPFVGYVVLFKFFGLSLTTATIVAAVGPLVLVAGLINTRFVWPIFTLAMLLAAPIGFVISAVLLRLIYYLLFTPIALWFRITGKDAMNRKWEPAAKTYWKDHRGGRVPASYLRLY